MEHQIGLRLQRRELGLSRLAVRRLRHQRRHTGCQQIIKLMGVLIIEEGGRRFGQALLLLLQLATGTGT